MEELTKSTEATPEVESEESITLTKAELDAMLQKEGDRRVTSALKKQEQKQREADKLRNMSDEDKREYDYQQRIAALEAKEKEFARLENKQAGLETLMDKGLDTSLIDLVLSDSGEEMYDRIKLLEKAFKKSVKAEVENRLKSKTPVQTVDTNKTYTTKDFSKMSMKDMAELYRESPESFEDK